MNVNPATTRSVSAPALAILVVFFLVFVGLVVTFYRSWAAEAELGPTICGEVETTTPHGERARVHRCWRETRKLPELSGGERNK